MIRPEAPPQVLPAGERSLIQGCAMFRKFLLVAALFAPVAAHAQSVGGSTSLALTTASASVALPASAALGYAAVQLDPDQGNTADTFVAFGTNSSVTAGVGTSLAVPPGGRCIYIPQNDAYIAGIIKTGTGTLYISQLTQCPQR